jgi:hypothetical protein
MNEEELKKGCGKETDYFNYIDCNDNEIFWKCGEEGEFIKVKVLCPTCQARLEGFQKGKLEQKKEELKFLKERCIYCMIADERIKQLQEEIGGMK